MEKDLIKAFQLNDEIILKSVYKSYKHSFFIFAKKYKLDEIELDDIYQESFIILRKQALAGKLANVQSSMKTYLFSISKNLIFNYLKQKSRKINNFKLEHLDHIENDEIIEVLDEELTPEQKILRFYFNQLGEKCKDVLTLSFYRGLTNEEIAVYRKYENEAVVRSQKSRCLKNLKEMIKRK